MGNCVSGLGLGMVKVDLNNKEDVFSTLWDVLSTDNDLTENQDFFRDDTLELGYHSEADRIVDEATRSSECNTVEGFKKVFDDVFKHISTQDYYCVCEFQILELTGSEIILAYAYGGNYSN